MSKYIKINKIFHIIFFILITTIILLQLLNKTEYIFFLTSIITNVLLVNIIIRIIKKEQIHFTKKNIIINILLIIILYLFYIISITTRKFIYYMDYSCYYNIQNETIQSFDNGLLSGIYHFIDTIWSGQYSNFISFFPQIIFQFTNKNINSYFISFIIILIPYLVFSYSILVKIFLRKINKYSENNYLSCHLLLYTMPLLHGALLYGQPDFFGLVFIFLIISLTINYNFKKLDNDRLLTLLLITVMLTITRKWYMYWIVTYYPIYAITILIKNKKDWKIITRNIFIYLILVTIIYIGFMLPMFKTIIKSNPINYYKFYSRGNIIYEFINQARFIGITIMILIIIGYLKKEYRKYSIIMFSQYLLMIFLFNLAQSFEKHQSLILLLSYLYGLVIIILEDNRIIKNVVICLVGINVIFGFLNTDTILFSNIKLKVENDSNYDNYEKIYKWLDKHIDKDNKAYMINHSKNINADKLRYFKTPNKNVHDNLSYGSAIIGIHKFPLELFDAKYVINTKPFESVSLDKKYNKVFNKLVTKNRFRLIKTFNLKDGYKVQIYERIKKVDEYEKNLYLDELKEESKLYKNYYFEEINSYIID